MAKEYLLSSVHVHTKLCDGKNTPEELALSAWKAGLKTLGFSGHSHTPHDIEYCMTNARTQLYRAQVAKLKERYAGKLDILAAWNGICTAMTTRLPMITGSAAPIMLRVPRRASIPRLTGAKRTWLPASRTTLTATALLWWKRILPT